MSNTPRKKNIYRQLREAADLTREQASELLVSIPPERIERIENEKFLPTPEEVCIMAEAYKSPELMNYYCVNQCRIGQQSVKEIKIKDLSQIVLEMVNSLNYAEKMKDRLVEITVDGEITDDEMRDFVSIDNDLEKLSIAVDTLSLWIEKMKASDKIDANLFNKIKKEMAE